MSDPKKFYQETVLREYLQRLVFRENTIVITVGKPFAVVRPSGDLQEANECSILVSGDPKILGVCIVEAVLSDPELAQHFTNAIFEAIATDKIKL